MVIDCKALLWYILKLFGSKVDGEVIESGSSVVISNHGVSVLLNALALLLWYNQSLFSQCSSPV